MGEELRSIPQRYRLTDRLWAWSFYLNLEALRQASSTSRVAYELLQDRLRYAYSFYEGLLKDEAFSHLRVTWLEALGDISRFWALSLTTARAQNVERRGRRDLNAETEGWRATAADWYLAGIKEEPGNGRLQHHAGICMPLRSIGLEALRSLYHFTQR